MFWFEPGSVRSRVFLFWPKAFGPLLVAGYWLLVAFGLGPAAGYWLLVAGYWLLVALGLRPAVGCWWLVSGFSMPVEGSADQYSMACD